MNLFHHTLFLSPKIEAETNETLISRCFTLLGNCKITSQGSASLALPAFWLITSAVWTELCRTFSAGKSFRVSVPDWPLLCGLCQKSSIGVLLLGSREGWLDSSRVGVSLSRSSRRVKGQVMKNTDYQTQQLSSELRLGPEVTPRRLLHYKGPWSTPGSPSDSHSSSFYFKNAASFIPHLVY